MVNTSPVDTSSKKSIAIVFTLYCVSLSSYLSGFINQVTLQIIAYLFTTILMLSTSRSNKIIYTKHDTFWTLLFIYLAMLLVRLLIDYIIPWQGMFLYKSPLTILFFYIFPILIPAVFFFRRRVVIDVEKTIWIISCAVFACLLASYNSIMQGNVELSNDGRYDSGFGVFSIAFGQYGTTLVLMSIYLISQNKHNFKLIKNIILGLFICIGFLSIVFSGSRGPFIALVACLFIWVVSNIKVSAKSVFIIILSLVAFVYIEDILYFINDQLKANDINSFTRILDTIFADDGLSQHSSGRDNLYIEAWELFLDNPIFGNSLFIPGKIYVHNIFIEQFMATGIIGGIIFILINIIAIKRSISIVRHDSKFAIIPILFIQNLIFGSLSITIISLPAYWLFLYTLTNKWDSDHYALTK